jgi:hypothetical protein
MPPFAPGYADPYTRPVEQFDIQVGKRIGGGEGSIVGWRPVGTYLEASIDFTWGLEVGGLVFSLKPDHPLNAIIQETGIKRRAYHVRATYNGIEFTGRIKKRRMSGRPGQELVTYECVDYKYWLCRVLFWVNPLFPPEVQIGLTGKQDMMFGPPDPVFKYFLAKNFTRLDRPFYCSLPIHWPSSWTQPNISAINSLDDLLDLIFDATEDITGLQCRFTPGDEAFTQTVDLLEMGVSVDFWDGHGTSPQVFNTDSLASLQSIIDFSSDHFLDLGQLLDPVNDGLFSLEADRASYVFDTAEKRDRRQVQFRTDGTQIDTYDYGEEHADATDAIVGGKSPSMVNELIEIGANLAIAAIIAAIATIPGAAGVAGLSIGVGDLFDDIFFAYQRFWDQDLEDDIGSDDAFAEGFADNTAAYSVDAYSTGKKYLKDHGGSEQLTINTISYGPTGRGITFGADDGTARRFQCGDIVTFWDRGNTVEQFASKVTIADQPGQRLVMSATFGDDMRLKGPWDRLLGGLGRAGALLNGFANST